MIYITGDTHIPIDIHKLSTRRWPKQNNLTKDDYLIVCGDFGLIWNYLETGLSVPANPDDRHWVPEELFWYKWLNEKPFTTLWIDGNHENFDRLKTYPVTEWHGGKVQKISDSIIHLMRGQVYEIDGSTFFTLGGARSIDRGPATGTEKRDSHIIWWPEEQPSVGEYDEALSNLEVHGNKVDYIITHEAPPSILLQKGYQLSELANFLWQLNDTVEFERWYCGQLHEDEQYGKVRVLFDDMVVVGE